MKLLITGSNGFIGKNLIAHLQSRGYSDILAYDADADESVLDKYSSECEFVFHLAGVNRTDKSAEFMAGNCEFTAKLLDCLKKHNNKASVLMTSSIQAECDNPYGESKRAGEKLLFSYEKETGAKAFVYRLPNVFGKWCRPNYNSVVATFCHNIARGLPIQVNDPAAELSLVYIDDVVAAFICAMEGHAERDGEFCHVKPVYRATVGRIAELLRSFHVSRTDFSVPYASDLFVKKLYSTYLSYIPTDALAYPLNTHADDRGCFAEIIRTPERGQFSVNISKPGVVKGNHWHHTKNEKFLVVSGHGLIRFRRVNEPEIIEYSVSGDKLEVVDIPPGYVHNICNLGDSDLIVFMWASECFDKETPDTYYLEV